MHAQKASLRISAGYGFVIPHNPEMWVYLEHHVPSFGIDWNHETDGSKIWQEAFLRPEWGLTADYFDLRTSTLGSAFGMLLYTDLPLNKTRKLWLKMAAGLGYLSNPYSVLDNEKNNAIGSHINAALQLRLSTHTFNWLNANWRAYISLTHFSNGAVKMPNLGINLPAIGLLVNLKAPQEKDIKLSKPKIDHNLSIWTGASAGVKEMLPMGSPSFGIANLFVTLAKRVSAKSSIGLSIDGEYNFGNAWSLEKRELAPSSRILNTQIGLAGMWKLHFGKIGFIFEMGSEIYSKYKEDGHIFNRYSLTYSLNQRLDFFAGLRAHFAKADHVETGLIYKFTL